MNSAPFVRYFIILSLSSLLSTSFFDLNDYLTAKIQLNNISTEQLLFAQNKQVDAALLKAWQNSKQGSITWLQLSKKLGYHHGNIALKLAEYYSHNSQPQVAILWYQLAKKLHTPNVIYYFSFHYYQQKQFSEAFELMKKNADDLSQQALVLMANVGVRLGKLSEVQTLIDKLLRFPEGKIQVKQLMEFSVFSTQVSYGNSLSSKHLKLLSKEKNLEYWQYCSQKNNQNKIQFFATNLPDLIQLKQTVKRIRSLSVANNFCFQPVRYISLPQLSCNLSPKRPIRCNEQALAQLSMQADTRYVGVMLPSGGANVHYGVLYIDKHDSDNVIRHELSHLLGFVDEYPLPKNHPFCNNIQPQDRINQSLNVLAISKKNLIKINTVKKQGWLQSNTCRNGNLQSFKRWKQKTLLEQNDAIFPLQYQQVYEQSDGQFQMPSFHYNVALALDDAHLAEHWLTKATLFEHNKPRIQKLRSLGY